MKPRYQQHKDNGPTFPSLIEERRCPKRVPFAHYVLCRNREHQFLARGMDLSTQGLSVTSNLNPPVGSLLDVSFQLPGEGTSLHCQAMVVRYEERIGSFWALRFVEAKSSLSSPLKKFIARQFLLNRQI